MRCGKGHRQKGVPLPTFATGSAQLLSCAKGAGRTMVSVGNIQRWHRRKRLHQGTFVSRVHPPDGVQHAVGRCEIVERPGGCHMLDEAVDRRRRAVDQEHRAGLGMQRQQVPRAIVFLVLSRALVLLDDVALVLVE